jgi:molybdopterin synthase sulfur carrier subunit
MIRVLYFASLRERLGTAAEDLDTVPVTVGALRDLLAARGGPWQEAFTGSGAVLCAVNQEMADAVSPLRDGDEVGFFPPVTSG